MKSAEFFIRSRRVVTLEGVRPAAIHVRGEKVVAIVEHGAIPRGARVEDFGELVVMPGLVDTHVHINEPGRADWEGFETATRAAAAGGVTTLIEMPLNSIPATTSVKAFREKLEAAKGKLQVDVGFWGGVVPGNTKDLAQLYEAGVFGFKCFIVPSGVPEFEHVTEKDLRHAMPVLKMLDALLLVHAELPEPIEKELRHLKGADPKKYKTWLLSRPPSSEIRAIELLARLSREFGVRVHIVHVSGSSGLSSIQKAKNAGLPMSAETCPHYLFFASEQIRSGGTEFKCAPPIRESRNRGKLWRGLKNRVLEMVVTDHSPCPPELKLKKSGDFMKAWGGIASLELSLAATWTKAAQHRFSVPDIAEWMCGAPARLAGLSHCKGAIAEGMDADFVIWNPEKDSRVTPKRLQQRHKLTPYAGERLCGVVEKTFVRGQCVYDGRGFPSGKVGQVLLRGKA
jgi:allantoinase